MKRPSLIALVLGAFLVLTANNAKAFVVVNNGPRLEAIKALILAEQANVEAAATKGVEAYKNNKRYYEAACLFTAKPTPGDYCLGGITFSPAEAEVIIQKLYSTALNPAFVNKNPNPKSAQIIEAYLDTIRVHVILTSKKFTKDKKYSEYLNNLWPSLNMPPNLLPAYTEFASAMLSCYELHEQASPQTPMVFECERLPLPFEEAEVESSASAAEMLAKICETGEQVNPKKAKEIVQQLLKESKQKTDEIYRKLLPTGKIKYTKADCDQFFKNFKEVPMQDSFNYLTRMPGGSGLNPTSKSIKAGQMNLLITNTVTTSCFQNIYSFGSGPGFPANPAAKENKLNYLQIVELQQMLNQEMNNMDPKKIDDAPITQQTKLSAVSFKCGDVGVGPHAQANSLTGIKNNDFFNQFYYDTYKTDPKLAQELFSDIKGDQQKELIKKEFEMRKQNAEALENFQKAVKLNGFQPMSGGFGTSGGFPGSGMMPSAPTGGGMGTPVFKPIPVPEGGSSFPNPYHPNPSGF